MRPTITHVALTLWVVLWPIATGAQPAGEARSLTDPLWVKVLLGMAGVVVAALVTGLFGLWQTHKKFKQETQQTQKKFEQDMELIKVQRREDLAADMQKIERQMAEQFRADVRTQAARLRERYVNALPFHTRLLKEQMVMVTEKLEHHHKHEMQGWFKRIKAHCEDKIDRHDPQTAKKFSEFCHYEGIFALSTLYYTSVFFLYSQQIRSLAPFSELDPCFGAELEGLLQQVGDAFARKGINEERGGLWPPVQDNMGATVKKGDWYQSYPEFCRIFIEETPTCEYHVFFRALDFFGAFDGAFDKPSCALLDTEGAKAIVTALEALLRFLPTNEAGGRGMCAASLDAFVG